LKTLGANHPLTKEIFPYIYSTAAWLQFVSMIMGYAICFDNKK